MQIRISTSAICIATGFLPSGEQEGDTVSLRQHFEQRGATGKDEYRSPVRGQNERATSVASIVFEYGIADAIESARRG